LIILSRYDDGRDATVRTMRRTGTAASRGYLAKLIAKASKTRIQGMSLSLRQVRLFSSKIIITNACFPLVVGL
jgi:hypothetical protein